MPTSLARKAFLLARKFISVSALSFMMTGLLGAQENSATSEPSRWLKGNIHTHSLWSDGDDFPEMISAWYKENGYQFLALTDHNILSRQERWMKNSDIEKRGGKDALQKYRDKFGSDWVETKTDEKSQELVVRLKKLEEYRGKIEVADQFLLMEGEEISDSVNKLPLHINATNIQQLILPAGGTSIREAAEANLRAVAEQASKSGKPILAHINHPNFGYGLTAEDLAFIVSDKFFEVFNGHPGVNQLGDDQHASIDRMWDIANSIRIKELKLPPLFGVGTDDSHDYHDGKKGASVGRAWVMVRAKGLDAESILGAMQSGEFYASSGVDLEEIKFDADSKKLTIKIKSQPGETFVTEFLGTSESVDLKSEPMTDKDGKELSATRKYSDEVGKVLATVEGETASYQLTGGELYVRARITSSAAHDNPTLKDQKKQAWTQPVGWEKRVK